MKKTGMPTNDEILECLYRSGYMLESRLVQTLVKAGYFVDPNQIIVDPVTGKSREIDLIAEFFDRDKSRLGVAVKTIFVIEAINNLYPLILTTERPSSPNAPIDDYVQCWTTGPSDIHSRIDIWSAKYPEEVALYSQYCAVQRKKDGELMVSHSDDLYSSLSKAVQFCAEEFTSRERRGDQNNDRYWRAFFWRPILVLQNDLLVLEGVESGEPVLTLTKSAKLEFNYHDEDRPRAMIVDVVVESALVDFMNSVVCVDRKLEETLALSRDEDRSDA